MADVDSSAENHSSALCLACGICCTGALHPTALLGRDEAEQAKSLGLTILDNPEDSTGLLFALGCPRFTGRCSVFPNRPRVCGTYQCRLLTDYLELRISLEEGLQIVQKAQEAIQKVEALVGPIPPGTTIHEQVKQRLAAMPTGTPEERRAYMALLLDAQALRIELGRFLK